MNHDLKDVRAFLLDIDGTTLMGSKAIPGAVEFATAVRKSGRRLLWLTNNSSRSREHWLERLDDAGLRPSTEEVFTSGDATIDFLQDRDPIPPIHLIGTRSLAASFRDAGLVLTDENPEVLVLGYDTELTYATLCAAGHLLRNGIEYIATHPDVTCPGPDGPIPDVGSLIALFETAYGRTPRIIGKPGSIMMTGALRRVGCGARDTLMVGDRPATDIRMANHAGVRSCLVHTGVTAPEEVPDLDPGDRPTLSYSSIADLIPLV